jgi:protein TonB
MLLNLLNLLSMSKLSLYETKWTDLVFENKNKDYGAYQLRQESSRNSLSALLLGLLLIATLVSSVSLLSKFQKGDTATVPDSLYEPLITVKLENNPIVQDEQPPQLVTPKPPVTEASAATQLVNPVVVQPQHAIQDIASNTDNVAVADNTAGSTGAGFNDNATSSGSGDAAVLPIEDNSPAAINTLDKMPEFPGGINKFYKYVGNNFKNPELDLDRTVKIYVSFVIEKDGSMTDIMVKNDPGYGLGKEAVRVLKSLKTKWTPGIINSKPVRTAYNLPITIKLEAE